MTVDVALQGAGVAFFDDRVAPRPGQFTPEGVVIHHTASPRNRSDAAILNVVRNGVNQPSGFLNGPLCNILINRAAETRLVSTGKANDTGTGNQSVLDRVVADQTVLGDATTVGNISGNRWFFDIEIANNGTGEIYSPAVMTASIHAAAALCHHNAWNPKTRVIGHREWTSRKIDPSFNMVQFRHDVNLRVAVLQAEAAGGAPASGAAGAQPGPPRGPELGTVREVLVSGAEAAFAQLRDVDGVFVDGHAVTAVDAGQRSSIMLATPDAVAQLRGLGFTVTETAENTQELAQLEALLTSNEAGLTGFS